jgi:hypothetical protein
MKDRVNEEVLDDHRKNKMLKKSVPDLEKCKWIIINNWWTLNNVELIMFNLNWPY